MGHAVVMMALHLVVVPYPLRHENVEHTLGWGFRLNDPSLFVNGIVVAEHGHVRMELLKVVVSLLVVSRGYHLTAGLSFVHGQSQWLIRVPSTKMRVVALVQLGRLFLVDVHVDRLCVVHPA